MSGDVTGAVTGVVGITVGAIVGEIRVDLHGETVVARSGPTRSGLVGSVGGAGGEDDGRHREQSRANLDVGVGGAGQSCEDRRAYCRRGDHHHDAEPDGAVSQRQDHREHHRQGQHQHGDPLQKGAQHNVGGQDDQQVLPAEYLQEADQGKFIRHWCGLKFAD